LNDAEMNILSSAMLDLSLETNFSIHEVHYSPVITGAYNINTFPNFGRNTRVNKVVGSSFSLYNPNNSDYMFRIEKVSSNTARLVLVGLPFVDTITAEKIETNIGYITQYTNDDQLIQSGSNGKIVIIHRVITNLDNVILYDKDIIFEFYPPVTEITLEPIPE